ncbi:Uncharacterised protein [Acinetobacter baumannii]|nr:Uncharacterised protein [Acinetobacter baumannii]SVK02866.1 Uncharacterised protein [Acinetobacter baumannii]
MAAISTLICIWFTNFRAKCNFINANRYFGDYDGNYSRYYCCRRYCRNPSRFKTYRQRRTCRYVFKCDSSYLWFIHAKCFCPKCWTGGNYRYQKPLCRGSRRSHSDYFRSITCYGPPYCGNSYASTWWCGFGLIWFGYSEWYSHFGKN